MREERKRGRRRIRKRRRRRKRRRKRRRRRSSDRQAEVCYVVTNPSGLRNKLTSQGFQAANTGQDETLQPRHFNYAHSEVVVGRLTLPPFPCCVDEGTVHLYFFHLYKEAMIYKKKYK